MLEINTQSINTWIVNQLGLSVQAQSKLVFRLKEIRFWAFQYGPATDRVEVNGEIGGTIATVSDPVDAQTQNAIVSYPVLYKFQDFGSLDEPAAAGFRWPIAHQQQPLFVTSNFTIAQVSSNSKSWTMHLHLEWSTSEILPPPPAP